MKRRLQNSLTIPSQIVWTVEDWKDFYETLRRFKARLLKRHGLDARGKRLKDRASASGRAVERVPAGLGGKLAGE